MPYQWGKSSALKYKWNKFSGEGMNVVPSKAVPAVSLTEPRFNVSTL